MTPSGPTGPESKMGGSKTGGSEPQVSRRVVIANARGLHARAAARFVKLADTFDAVVTVLCKAHSVSGVSIMGLMMLAAGPGTEITVTASGTDAQAALTALTTLVEAGFDED